MSVPREPEFYSPTCHALNRKKERNIPWDLVSETIQDGEISPTKKENCYHFIAEYPAVDTVTVVANTETGEIITVDWGLPSHME